jgi:hypothetical protein|tara:strand:+ start:59 stop:805 length:747 start_codon:yes stop_codon:yes gene_type:complete
MKLLELVYRGILTGMPLLTYNPITKNTLNVPMIVNPESTYLNFKLDNEKVKKLEKYVKKYSNLTIIPIKMDEKEEYILSVNVYNCTSPVFLNDKEITRFEINTYVRDEYNNNGTLILDYISNELSMDPLNIIKWKEDLVYNKYDVFNYIECNSKRDRIELNINFTAEYAKKIKIDEDLVKYTDRVYYKNGIYDKIYFDSSLTSADLREPYLFTDFKFIYRDLNFTDLHSIFYFKNEIRFIGGMWDNLF